MFVPFFTVDSELTAIGKLKILFLVRKLRNIDILFFIFFLLPFFINLVWFVCLKGQNNLSSMFYPATKLFGDDSWINVGSFIHFFIIFFIFVFRFMVGRSLYVKMKEFEKKNLGFRWSRKSRFWFMIFVPGITFSVYRLLSRLTNFEALHKYNL